MKKDKGEIIAWILVSILIVILMGSIVLAGWFNYKDYLTYKDNLKSNAIILCKSKELTYMYNNYGFTSYVLKQDAVVTCKGKYNEISRHIMSLN